RNAGETITAADITATATLPGETTTDTTTETNTPTIPTFTPIPKPLNDSSTFSNATDDKPTLTMSLPVGITSFPTANVDPTATPTPRPPTDKAAAHLITHMHDRVLRDYELYSTA